MGSLYAGGKLDMTDPRRQAMMAAGAAMLNQGYSKSYKGALQPFGAGAQAGMGAFNQATALQRQEEDRQAKKADEIEEWGKENMAQTRLHASLSDLPLNEQQKIMATFAVDPGKGLQAATAANERQRINQAVGGLDLSGLSPQQQMLVQQYGEVDPKKGFEAASGFMEEAQLRQQFEGMDLTGMPPAMREIITNIGAQSPSAAIQAVGQYQLQQAKNNAPGQGPDVMDRFTMGGADADTAGQVALNEFFSENGRMPNSPEELAQVASRQNAKYDEITASSKVSDAYRMGMDEMALKDYQKVVDASDTANQTIRDIHNMRSATMNGENTGKMSEWFSDWGGKVKQLERNVPALKGLGLGNAFEDLAGISVGEAQWATATQNKLALGITAMLAGQISEKELQFALDAVASVGQEAFARDMLLDMSQIVAEEQIALENFASDQLVNDKDNYMSSRSDRTQAMEARIKDRMDQMMIDKGYLVRDPEDSTKLKSAAPGYQAQTATPAAEDERPYVMVNGQKVYYD